MVRAQYTMEFILVFTLVFMAFVLMVVLVTNYVGSIRSGAEAARLNSLAEDVRKNIMIAYETRADIEIRVTLPQTAQGLAYSIWIDAQADVLHLQNSGLGIAVVKHLPDVSGQIQKGCNIIEKNGAQVDVSPC